MSRSMRKAFVRRTHARAGAIRFMVRHQGLEPEPAEKRRSALHSRAEWGEMVADLGEPWRACLRDRPRFRTDSELSTWRKTWRRWPTSVGIPLSRLIVGRSGVVRVLSEAEAEVPRRRLDGRTRSPKNGPKRGRGLGRHYHPLDRRLFQRHCHNVVEDRVRGLGGLHDRRWHCPRLLCRRTIWAVNPPTCPKHHVQMV